MTLHLNETLAKFREQFSAYDFVSDHTRALPDHVRFFPNKRPLVTPALTFTAAVGLSLVFVALIVLSLLLNHLDYFQGADGTSVVGNSGLIVSGALLVVTLTIAFVSRKRYHGQQQFLADAAALKTTYRDGLYVLDDGIIFRDRQRIDMFPFDRINRVRRTVLKRMLGNDVHHFHLLYGEEGSQTAPYFARDGYYGLEDSDLLWNKLAAHNVPVDSVQG